MSNLEDIKRRVSALAAVESPDQQVEITAWRDQIDAIDQIIMLLLNERSVCANNIGHIKKDLNLPIYVPEREKIVLENVLRGNPGPLDDAAIRALFERIVDETRSLERRKYQNPDHL